MTKKEPDPQKLTTPAQKRYRLLQLLTSVWSNDEIHQVTRIEETSFEGWEAEVN